MDSDFEVGGIRVCGPRCFLVPSQWRNPEVLRRLCTNSCNKFHEGYRHTNCVLSGIGISGGVLCVVVILSAMVAFIWSVSTLQIIEGYLGHESKGKRVMNARDFKC